MDDHEHLDESNPARAQFRALRVAAIVLLQLAADLKEEEEARQIVGVENLSELEVDMISTAVSYLAQELDLRAEQVYQANVRYLELFSRRN